MVGRVENQSLPKEEVFYFAFVALAQIRKSLSIKQTQVFIAPLGLFFCLLGRPDTRPSPIPLSDSFP